MNCELYFSLRYVFEKVSVLKIIGPVALEVVESTVGLYVNCPILTEISDILMKYDRICGLVVRVPN
jgi:hypothetical protein